MFEGNGVEQDFGEMRLEYQKPTDSVEPSDPAETTPTAQTDQADEEKLVDSSQSDSETVVDQAGKPETPAASEKKKAQADFNQVALRYQQAHGYFTTRFAAYTDAPATSETGSVDSRSEFKQVADGFNKQTLAAGENYDQQLEQFLVELKQIRQENPTTQLTVQEFIEAFDNAELADIVDPDELQQKFLTEHNLLLPEDTSFDEYLAQNPEQAAQYAAYQEAIEADFKERKKTSLGEKLLKWGVDITTTGFGNSNMDTFIELLLIGGVFNSRAELNFNDKLREQEGFKPVSAGEFKEKLQLKNRTLIEKKQVWMKVSGSILDYLKFGLDTDPTATIHEWAEIADEAQIKLKMKEFYNQLLTKGNEGKHSEIDAAFKKTFDNNKVEFGLEPWGDKEVVGSELVAFFQLLSTQDSVIEATFSE